jgi:hypothetical protein
MAIGGIIALAVTDVLYNWVVPGISQSWYNLIDALSQSCYAQQNLCAAAAAAANQAYELTNKTCYNVQINACLTNAHTVAANWSPTSSSAINSASASAWSVPSAQQYSQSVLAQQAAQYASAA